MDRNKDTELAEHIKELLVHLKPMIHCAGSSENTLEMLLYLPEMDPNFYKLEVVRWLRRMLRDSLAGKIENDVKDYLGMCEGKIKEENVVDLLEERLYQDKSFENFKSHLENLLKDTVYKIDQNVQNDSFKELVSEEDYDQNKVSPINSNETSLNSSLNQSGFLFLMPAQYNNIAESLKKKHLYENLHASLDLLLKVTPGEPVSQTVWPTIRKSLKGFLQSDDDEIFLKSLQFHSRLLSSQIHSAVKEGFLNLVEALSGFWLSKKLVQKVVYSNSVINIEDNKVLVIMKVLFQFLKEFPSLWIRYPSQYVSEMIDSLLSVFAVHVVEKDDHYASFLDFLCLLDPRALWFHSWTHGQLGRKKTFEALKNKSSLLSFSLSFCFNYLDKNHDAAIKIPKHTASANYIEFFKFYHSLSIIMCILRYSEGRDLFPVYDYARKDHFTLKKVFQVLTNVVKLMKQNSTSHILLHFFSRFCNAKENLCKILCEFGVVDSLIEALSINVNPNKGEKLKSWYYQLLLEFFTSINVTSVGHEYILTGKLNKTMAKVNLTTNIQTPAQKIFSFMKDLLISHYSLSPKVVSLGFELCCSLLQSPLGQHLFLTHPLITDMIYFLQQEFNIKSDYSPQTQLNLQFGDYFVYIIEELLHSYNGIIMLENNHVLTPILDLILPQLAMKGRISCKLLNKILCSEQGCVALGRNHIIKPFWEMLFHIREETVFQPVLQYEDMDDVLEEALIPILCVSSTLEGTKCLFSKVGLLDELSAYLLSPEEQETENYSLSLRILGSATSNIDGLFFLENLLNVSEVLQKHQSARKVKGNVIVDENSIMRSHILSTCFIPKGTKRFPVDPFLLDGELPAKKMNIVESLPIQVKDKGDRLTKGAAVKKQSELWRFLNDTRTGLHDSTWLIHCRRAFRSELLTNEETKTALLMELVELSLDALSSSAEESLPGCSRPFTESVAEDIPSPISTSFNNNVFCYPLSSDGESSAEEESPTIIEEKPKQFPFSDDTHLTPSSGIEMMIRYGSELNLIPDNTFQRSNLLKLKIAVESFLLETKSQRVDWFSILFYYLTCGNVDKTFSLLRKLRKLKIGVILWPAFMGSIWKSLKLAPNEILFGSIIHCTKLVIFRDSPEAFLAFEGIGGGIIWNMLSEWLNQSFVGVLTWPENFYMMLVPLLHGSDYLIYALVCLLLHIHRSLVERTSQTHFKKIIYLQTQVIDNWKIQDHFLYMDSLSKKFRRIVLDALTLVKLDENQTLS